MSSEDNRPALLVSACLLGERCRYDGASARPSAREPLHRLSEHYRLVAVCPEHEGGLGTPRPPAQFLAGDGEDALDGTAHIATHDGRDVTAEFIAGAQIAAARAKNHAVVGALLKARSPSCGSTQTHSGGKLVSGAGVTAALLSRRGLVVLSEEDYGRDAAGCRRRWDTTDA